MGRVLTSSEYSDSLPCSHDDFYFWTDGGLGGNNMTMNTQTSASGDRLSRSFFLLIAFLFLISGATGLIYQVVWTRMFTIVFGNTTYAVSAVLTAFMAGLALGSFIFGRFVDSKRRVLLIYALIEVGIAGAALLLPAVVEASESVYVSVYRAFPESEWLLTLVKGGISFVILLVPTFLMGATLPVLSRFMVQQSRHVGSRVGLLYAVNTLGATIGCLITGFYLIELLGISATVRLAAAANLSLALVFFLLDRLVVRAGERPGNDPESSPVDGDGIEAVDGERPLSAGRLRTLLVAFGLAGFCSLAYEVLWFRVLVMQLKTTTYSFTVMLAAFLSGIALGSALFSVLESRIGSRASSDRRAYWLLFGWIEAGIGLVGLLSITLFAGLENLVGQVKVESWTQLMVKNYLIAAAIMLVPATLMGMAFPVVCRIVSRSSSKIGASVGGVYAANTVGCIFGPLVTGFILVRALGTQWTIVLIAILNLIVATVIILKERNLLRTTLLSLVWVGAGAGILFIPSDLLYQYYNVSEKSFDSRVKILYAHEGLECITTVHEYPPPSRQRVISTGSVNVAGTGMTLRTTQKLQAHIPLLVHPAPKELLQIGFGSGETSGIVTGYDIDRLDLVDISEGVLKTSARYFEDINKGVVDHPKFHPIIMDGANYLRVTDKKYDVIMNDATWPFLAGCNALYTRDHFEAGRSCLKPGGFMTSWFPLDMSVGDFKILLKTINEVFPHVQVWVGVTHRNKHCLVLGSMERAMIDTPRFLERFGRFAAPDLREVGLHQPAVFLSCLVMDEKAFGPKVAGAPLNTNDNPVLEFSSRRRTGMFTDMRDIFQFIVDTRMFLHGSSCEPINYLSRRESLEKSAREEFSGKVRAATSAATHILGAVILRESEDERFMVWLDEAEQIFPGHPGVRYLRSEVNQIASIDPADLAKADLKKLMRISNEMLKTGNTAKALEILREADRRFPGDHRVQFKLGFVYNKLGKLQEAATVYKEAVRLKPDFVQCLNNLGLVLVNLGDLDGGIDAYRRALELEPNEARLHFNLGLAHAQKGERTEAIRCYKKVLEIRPDPNPENEVVHEALRLLGAGS